MPIPQLPGINPAPDWILAMSNSTDVSAIVDALPFGVIAPPAPPVVPPAPPEILTSISPTGASVGDPAALVTLTGTGFSASTVATIDGVDATTTFVSSTSVTIVVPTIKFASAGSVVIGIKGTPSTQTLTVA